MRCEDEERRGNEGKKNMGRILYKTHLKEIITKEYWQNDWQGDT
jgi:hypothetical protein